MINSIFRKTNSLNSQFIINSLFIFSYLVPTLVYINRVLNGGNKWQTGDWLINFNGGFVRRGIMGSILIPVSNQIYLSPIFLTGVLQIVLFSFFVVTIFLESKKLNSLLRVLILSPVGLFFYVNDPDGTFRKEILVFSTLILILKKLNKSRINIISYSIIYLFLIFSWETVVFFWPLILLLLLAFGYLDFASTIKLFWIFFIVTAGYLFFIYKNLQDVNVYKICVFLGLKSNEEICTGAISWSGTTPSQAMGQFITRNSVIWAFIFCLILMIFCILIVSTVNFAFRSKCITALVVGFFFWSPIFLISPDFGRSINTFFMIFVIFIIFNAVKINNVSLKGIFQNRFILFGFFFLFQFCWGLPHWFGLLEHPNNLSFLDFSLISRIYNWLAISVFV